MTREEIIKQLIEWGQDQKDLEEMNIKELKELFKELYNEFQGIPSLYPNIDNQQEYEEEMEHIFAKFVDN